jgi:hypothetical protein
MTLRRTSWRKVWLEYPCPGSELAPWPGPVMMARRRASELVLDAPPGAVIDEQAVPEHGRRSLT